MRDDRQPVTAAVRLDGAHLAISLPYEARALAKELGGIWHPADKTWRLPAEPGPALALGRALRAADLYDRDRVASDARNLMNAGREAERLAQEARSSGSLEPPARTVFALWEHQLRAYHFARAQPGVLFDLAPGTGKTKVAVDLFVNESSPGARGLVLCPHSVIEDVWLRQVPLHSGDPRLVVVGLDRGTVREKLKRAEEALDGASASDRRVLLVINYESAWREPFASWAKGRRWDLLVLDESHRIKSPTGKQSRFARELGRVARRRLALTGTPAPHSPLDLWAQLDAVAPGVLPSRFHPFKFRYGVHGGFQSKQVVGFRNLEELAKRLEPVMFKIGNEVLDLPSILHERRTFDLPPAARKAYDHLKDDLYLYLESGDEVTIDNVLTKLLRLAQLTGGWAQPDGVGEALQPVHTGKRDLFAELLEDLPPEEPVVVFARFHSDLDDIAVAARSVGRGSFELSGRRKELAAWKAASSGEVLAAQMQSGGVGIDLTRSRFTVFYSMGFSYGDYLQCLARVHRPGQGRPVVVYHLIGRDTIDVETYQALARKEDVVAAIVGKVGVDYDTGLHRLKKNIQGG